jgi:hypothetical protein
MGIVCDSLAIVADKLIFIFRQTKRSQDFPLDTSFLHVEALIGNVIVKDWGGLITQTFLLLIIFFLDILNKKGELLVFTSIL